MKNWKKVYVAFLVLLGIGGIIMRDYLATGFLLSGNVAFLLDAKKSQRSKIGQLVLMSIAIILGGIYFYLRIKEAKK